MYESFSTFCQGLSTKEIDFLNKRIDTVIKSYTFLHVTRKLSFDLDQKIFFNYQNSNLIIIKYYNKSNKNKNDQYFLILFKQNVFIIEQSSISLLQLLFSFSDKPFFCFLSNSKDIFDSHIKIQYKEIQNILKVDDEVDNMSEYLSYRGNKPNLFWKICKKCLCYYFIHQGYFKSNQNRIENFYESNKKVFESRIIEEDEYLTLSRLGVGSESQAYLIYHIEMEELMVLKMPINANSEEIEKLYEREINNYSKLNHPFLPKFYGVVKRKKYIIIEYINGRTLYFIKELEFNKKIEIIYCLMLILNYFHDNNLIYRDLKPDNIMIDNNNTIAIIDFDRLIQFSDIVENKPRTVDFSSEFIAPEVNTGYFSYKCDIYSLGKIIYYIMNINSKEMPTNDWLKKYPKIEKIYKNCINKNPEERPNLIKMIYDFYYEFQPYIPEYIPKVMAQFILVNEYTFYLALSNIFEISKELSVSTYNIINHFIKLALLQKNSAILNKFGEFCEKSLEIIGNNTDVRAIIYYAIKLYELAFSLNNLDACYNLAMIYFDGKYIDRNINKAFYYFNYASKQNHIFANLSLAIIYSNGFFVTKDIEKAKHYLKITEEIKDPIIQYKIGLFYLQKYYDHENAIKFLTLSANQNYSFAQNFLGKMYAYGIYVERDIQKAIYYFTLSAENNNDCISQYELGRIYIYYNHDIEKTFIYMTRSANQNYLPAERFLGVIHYDKIYVPRDINKSLYYLAKAASKNDSCSQLYLGYIFSDKNLDIFNINKAIYYLNLSACQNNADSLIKLANIYINNAYGIKDINKSISYLTKAAKLNSIEALNRLGIIYCDGYCVPKDIKKSIYYLSLAQKQNDPESSYLLGVIYENGKYITPNIKKAIEYYLFAANLNHPNAQLNLGYIYLEGKVVKKDIEKAIYYYKLAANNSCVEAQYNLGLLYEKGEHVQKNMKKSIYYYELAAYRNDGPAQYKLGFFYIDGKYIERNINKGLNLLILSSENGFRPAHFMIGFLYHEGKFVERDINKAIHYYKKATSFNYQYALNNLGIIYKNGFKDKIAKNVSFAIEYFNDAINKKNDVVSMYNLANIYLYDIQSDDNVLKSIDILVNSLNLKFAYTQELLLVALIKQFGYDFEKYRQLLNNYIINVDDVLNIIINNIFAIELDEQSNFEALYEYYKNVDFIYNYKKEVIPSKSIFDSTKDNNAQCINIDKDFYDGFGQDVLNK